MKKNIAILLLSLVVSIVAGCATNQSFVMPDKDFRQYKTAYVELRSPDQFNIGSAIVYELGDMGFQVVTKPAPANATSTDMTVKYSYASGWDMSIYLKSFQITFSDAQSGAVIGNISYSMSGAWVKSDSRITSGFNEFRKKLGFPESKRGDTQ